MAQLVQCPTVDFGSGRDAQGREMEPQVGLCTGREACLKFSLRL